MDILTVSYRAKTVLLYWFTQKTYIELFKDSLNGFRSHKFRDVGRNIFNIIIKIHTHSSKVTFVSRK